MIRKTFFVVFGLVALSMTVFGVASSFPREIKWDLYHADRHWASLSAYDGRIWLMHDVRLQPNYARWTKHVRFGRCQLSSTIQGPLRVTLVSGPYWVGPLAFGISCGLPLLWVWRRRTLRCRGGACTQCGYDLTGLIEPRCPECGVAVVVSTGSRTERLFASRRFWPMVVLLLLVPVLWSEGSRWRMWWPGPTQPVSVRRSMPGLGLPGRAGPSVSLVGFVGPETPLLRAYRICAGIEMDERLVDHFVANGLPSLWADPSVDACLAAIKAAADARPPGP